MESMMLTANRRDHNRARIISLQRRLYAGAAALGEQSNNGRHEKHGCLRFCTGYLSVFSAVVFALLAAGCAPHFSDAYGLSVLLAVSGAVVVHLIFFATKHQERHAKRSAESAVLTRLARRIRDESVAALQANLSKARTQRRQPQPRPGACVSGRSMAHNGLTPKLLPIPKNRA